MYANRSTGPLSFWYEPPLVNERAFEDGRQYFMRFQGKAVYRGPFDGDDVPLLDYQGDIGRQYNPIAIAQYGLARFNRWCDTRSSDDEKAWLAAADWLERQLVPNGHGLHMWMHHFDWPYREVLRAPWYSGLAQGCGVSLLVRAADATGEWRYAKAAYLAFEPLTRGIDAGGVLATDPRGRPWIEEYIVRPPSHILNGFIWALWGVYDYTRFTGASEPGQLFDACVSTIATALPEYDTGRWSLYELPPSPFGLPPSPYGLRRTSRRTGPQMLASRYYHTLHIVQLRVLQRLTGIDTFGTVADRWQRYLESPMKRTRALVEKATFKLLHY